MVLDPIALARIRDAAAEIRALAGDDEVAYMDTLEGETDAVELLDALIEAAQHVAALEAATREQAQRLGERARRFADQGKGYRHTMRLILSAMDMRKVVRPGATLSVTAGRASVEIHDPASVPSQLRKPGEPDKAAISKQLEQGEDVPGCRIVVGEETLTLRTA